MQDRWRGQSMSAVVADGPIAKKGAVGTHQLVVVNGGHDRNPRIAASVENGSAKQRKRVVHVHNIGTMFAQRRLQLTERFTAPDGPDWKRRLLRPRPLLDLVAAAAEAQDLMSQGGERLALLVDNTVLPAGRSRAITVVDKQDPHAGWVTSPH